MFFGNGILDISDLYVYCSEFVDATPVMFVNMFVNRDAYSLHTVGSSSICPSVPLR